MNVINSQSIERQNNPIIKIETKTPIDIVIISFFSVCVMSINFLNVNEKFTCKKSPKSSLK